MGLAPDRDGDKLLEALLLFRRVLYCRVDVEAWPLVLLLSPFRRFRSMPVNLLLSATCFLSTFTRIYLRALAFAQALDSYHMT